jgi:hypothetical protein
MRAPVRSTAARQTRCRFVLLASLLAAPLAARAQESRPAPKPFQFDQARYFGQCEIFLLKNVAGNLEGLVYNTTPLNDCPPAQFDPIDPVALAKQEGVDVAWKNPRRFWTMDRLTVELVGDPREFDGLKFNFVARMRMPPNFKPGEGQAGFAYKPTQIRRNTTYVYLAGKPVFLLRSPDDKTWVMQTYTTHTDARLTAADLPSLAQRLKLPPGWRFQSRTLDRDLTIATTGLANIVPDDLEDMYQGCIDSVCNFDPWK